jgi:hypothetical protein
MSRTARRAAWATAVVSALLLASAARALPPPPPPEPDWEVELFLNGWLPWVFADVEAHGIKRSFDFSFPDLLKNLGWAFMGGGQVRYKRMLLQVDAVGVQLADNVNFNSATRPFNLFGPLGPGGSLTVGPGKVSTRATLWFVDNKFGYRAMSMPLSKLMSSLPPEDPRRIDADIMLGLRYWDVRNKMGLSIDPAVLTIGGKSVDLSGVNLPNFRHGDVRIPGNLLKGVSGKHFDSHDTWVDPVIELRVRGDITRSISLIAAGDIGGFSAWNNASSLTWQGMLGARWQFARHWSTELGYRALGVQRNGALDNGILYGPQISMIFNF